MADLEQSNFDVDLLWEDTNILESNDADDFTFDMDQYPDSYKWNEISVWTRFEKQIMGLKSKIPDVRKNSEEYVKYWLEQTSIGKIKDNTEFDVYTDNKWENVIRLVEPYEVWNAWRTILLKWEWFNWKYSIAAYSKWLSLEN